MSHIDAGVYQRQPSPVVAFAFAPAAGQPFENPSGRFCTAKVMEKVAYVIGKQYNYRQHSHVNQFVHQDTHQPHLQKMRYDYPDKQEDQNTDEHIK